LNSRTSFLKIIPQNQIGSIPGMQEWFNIHKSNINTVHQQEENKNNMIILIVREKAFGKLQHPFMTKALKKLGNKIICLNIIMLRLNMSSL
jgi:ABC-type Fe3+-citrate transport system substrate-binding protein